VVRESTAWLHRQQQTGGRPPRAAPRKAPERALTELVSALMSP